MSNLTLVIANKTYSSWSLRPWLAMRMADLPFAELVIPLDQPTTRAEILKVSPSGRVPTLHHGPLVIWESLAIIEYVAELAPAAQLWPADAAARALARAVSAEMHAGFAALRTQLPMNVRARKPLTALSPEVTEDVARITALWRDCRCRFGADGDFLFGTFTAADAMFAPVVTRFQSYGVEVDAVSRAYCDAIMALPAMQQWISAAMAEPWTIAKYERPS